LFLAGYESFKHDAICGTELQLLAGILL